MWSNMTYLNSMFCRVFPSSVHCENSHTGTADNIAFYPHPWWKVSTVWVLGGVATACGLGTRGSGYSLWSGY